MYNFWKIILFEMLMNVLTELQIFIFLLIELVIVPILRRLNR